LGISRQPVREALQRLQSEGWVDLRPSLGAHVHMPTEHETNQLLAVRTLQEAEAARLAAGAATEEHVQQLWELWRAGLDTLASGDTDALVTANADLHSYVMSMSGNSVLAELNELVDRRLR
jgi:DNA-binding GntR family transcriptional regulator